jgi:hypothetical protein
LTTVVAVQAINMSSSALERVDPDTPLVIETEEEAGT